MEYTANSLFFGNYLDASERLHEIEQFREYVDILLKKEKQYFEEEAHPDVEMEFLPLFAETFPPILHSSLIISCVILVELELKGFSQTLKDKLNLKLSIGDLSGSLLERFKKYITRVAGLDIKLDEDIWKDIIGVFEIRNCLVHHYGSLERFSRRSVIKDFVTRHNTPIIEENVLKFDENTSQKILDITSEFFETIYAIALEHFPGKYKLQNGSVKFT